MNINKIASDLYPTDTAAFEAFLEGFAAGNAGKGPQCNPYRDSYPNQGALYGAWRDGWHKAYGY